MLGGGVVGAVVEHVQSVPCDACGDRSETGVRRTVEKTRQEKNFIR